MSTLATVLGVIISLLLKTHRLIHGDALHMNQRRKNEFHFDEI